MSAQKKAKRAAIPAQGRAKDELISQLAEMSSGDADWRGGKVWSLIYHVDDDHEQLLEEAHNLYLPTNFLNPMAFKSLKEMESDLVQMTASMLNAPSSAVGTLTSGGTESILMAVKAARDRARKRRPWIRCPEIVVPETIHVAFDKAAHYFGLKVRYAPLDKDGRVNVKALKRLVSGKTVMIVASAPQYPHGSIDPIAEIGAFAKRKRIPFHVDACFGGFILPWLEELGYPIPEFDFRVEGVTSMSADLHKYGYASKGASVILYRDMSYLKHQFFISTDWPGGIYISPTMAGSRPGGPIAAAWASVMAMGQSGFRKHAQLAMESAERLRQGIDAIEGLERLGTGEATIVTYTSNDPKLSIFAVADLLVAKGWHVDRQHRPDSIHLTTTSHHTSIIDDYLSDLRAAVNQVRANPSLVSSGEAAMYGMMAKLPARSLVKWSVGKVMEQMYSGSGESPDLSQLDESSDGPLMRAVARYGPHALGALDKLADLRDKLPLKRRGRR